MADTPLFDKMNHVVVLMFEKLSYDHMLGLLDHPKLPTVLDEPLPNPIDPAQPGSPAFPAFELDGYEALSADPKHGFPDVMRQLTGHAEPWQPPYQLKNNGFAWNLHARRGASGTEVLGRYPPRLLPILSTLAREYTVCSRWFCSVPSETWPNRLFAHAATSDNLFENDEPPTPTERSSRHSHMQAEAGRSTPATFPSRLLPQALVARRRPPASAA